MYGINMKRESAKIDYSKQVFSEREKMMIKNEAVLIRLTYPKYTPVLVKTKSEKIKLTKYKFLASDDLTMAQFLFAIRGKMMVPLSSSESLFIFTNSIIPPNTSTFGELYKNYKDEETGMLVLTLCTENTFGNEYIKK